MRGLDVILIKNAEAAGREAAETKTVDGLSKIEAANDESIYEDKRLDRPMRRVLLDAFHDAFVREWKS